MIDKRDGQYVRYGDKPEDYLTDVLSRMGAFRPQRGLNGAVKHISYRILSSQIGRQPQLAGFSYFSDALAQVDPQRRDYDI